MHLACSISFLIGYLWETHHGILLTRSDLIFLTCHTHLAAFPMTTNIVRVHQVWSWSWSTTLLIWTARDVRRLVDDVPLGSLLLDRHLIKLHVQCISKKGSSVHPYFSASHAASCSQTISVDVVEGAETEALVPG